MIHRQTRMIQPAHQNTLAGDGMQIQESDSCVLCIHFGNVSENSGRGKWLNAAFHRRLFDNQHLSGMDIAAALAIDPLQGCDGSVVFTGYAVEGISTLHLVQALTACLG